MFFIDPPFGNYINLPHTTSIKGSFTLEPRPGLIWQIIKTLRYSTTYQGWINKIGLRNKGIDYAIKHYDGKHIVSIAILNEKEIYPLEKKIPKNMNIELNVSCPNVDDKHDKVIKDLNIFLNPMREWCIIKLSPLTDMDLVKQYYRQGFRQFHCSNTLPVKNGGLSGAHLSKYSIALCANIHKLLPNDTVIIGGGGITNMDIAKKYFDNGASHISASTLFFNPFNACSFYREYIKSKYNVDINK